MGKKGGLTANLVTGLKAIGGAIVHYIVMIFILIIFAFITGGLANLGTGLIVLLSMLLLITGVLVLGYIYRKFWGWK